VKSKKLGKTTLLTLTPKQVLEAKDFGTIKKTDGGYQATFRQVSDAVKITNGVPATQVSDTVLNKLISYANRMDGGSYQDWSRNVLAVNGIKWL
jgi:hypothetical protein